MVTKQTPRSPRTLDEIETIIEEAKHWHCRVRHVVPSFNLKRTPDHTSALTDAELVRVHSDLPRLFSLLAEETLPHLNGYRVVATLEAWRRGLWINDVNNNGYYIKPPTLITVNADGTFELKAERLGCYSVDEPDRAQPLRYADEFGWFLRRLTCTKHELQRVFPDWRGRYDIAVSLGLSDEDVAAYVFCNEQSSTNAGLALPDMAPV